MTACVGICAICGADLADDGARVCECQSARPSRLVQVVAQAVRLAGRAALVARGQS